MLVFHLFTWSPRVEGLFVLWGLVLLLGVVIFKDRKCAQELVAEIMTDETPAPPAPKVKKPRYAAIFAGYGLRGKHVQQ